MISFPPTLFQLLVSSYHLQGQVKAENNREIRHWPGLEWLHLREAMSWFIEWSISKFDISLRSMILIGRKAFLLKVSGTWDIFLQGRAPTNLLSRMFPGRLALLSKSCDTDRLQHSYEVTFWHILSTGCHTKPLSLKEFQGHMILSHMNWYHLLLLLLIIITIIISILRLMKHIQIFYLRSPASLFVSLGSRIWKMKKSKCDSQRARKTWLRSEHSVSCHLLSSEQLREIRIMIHPILPLNNSCAQKRYMNCPEVDGK